MTSTMVGDPMPPDESGSGPPIGILPTEGVAEGDEVRDEGGATSGDVVGDGVDDGVDDGMGGPTGDSCGSLGSASDIVEVGTGMGGGVGFGAVGVGVRGAGVADERAGVDDAVDGVVVGAGADRGCVSPVCRVTAWET